MKKVIGVSILCFLIDFLSKQLVISFLKIDQSIRLIPDFFYLTYVRNTGVAFSLLEGNLLFIVVMTCIIMGMIIQYLRVNQPNRWNSICYGMILGGALGNLLDRLVYGFVIDFLDFRVGPYQFPIFNFADVMVVVGVFLLFIVEMKESRGKR